MVNKDGLAYRGLARLSPAEDHLDGILYFGTDLYHFEKHRANAIALIRSVRWTKPDD